MADRSYKNYFVTGGAGFIGSHLVDRLMAEGKRVTVYDNLVSGFLRNIEKHIGQKNFLFVQDDLLNTDALTKAMKGHDIVWHLGANTDIPGGNKVTDLDLKNCTTATRNVLESMLANHMNQIVFASSATVYGDAPPTVRLSEAFGPLLPISLYGAGKLACEGLISSYAHLFGIQAWMYRFANVIGARMGNGVIYDFIAKLRKNPKELEILGDGKQEKPYFLVEDCIDGMHTGLLKTDGQYDVFNLGCESYSTVTNVGAIVASEMGLKDVKFRYTGGKRGWPGDVPVVHFDVNKIKRYGWQAKHTSDEAVRIATRRLLGK